MPHNSSTCDLFPRGSSTHAPKFNEVWTEVRPLQMDWSWTTYLPRWFLHRLVIPKIKTWVERWNKTFTWKPAKIWKKNPRTIPRYYVTITEVAVKVENNRTKKVTLKTQLFFLTEAQQHKIPKHFKIKTHPTNRQHDITQTVSQLCDLFFFQKTFWHLLDAFSY